MISGNVKKLEIDANGNLRAETEYTLTDGSKVTGHTRYSALNFSTDKVLAEKDGVIEELKKRVNTLEETKNGKKSLEEETPDKDTPVQKDGTFKWKFIENV